MFIVEGISDFLGLLLNRIFKNPVETLIVGIMMTCLFFLLKDQICVLFNWLIGQYHTLSPFDRVAENLKMK